MIVIRCTEKDQMTAALIKVNADDLRDDGTDWLGRRVKKPWGHEVEKYRDARCSISWMHIHHNQQTSMHCHTTKTASLFVMGGSGMVRTLNGDFPIDEGDVVVIERGAFHQIVSAGDPVVLYEVETPPNKRDLIRLHDAYGRGQGYEQCENSTL